MLGGIMRLLLMLAKLSVVGRNFAFGIGVVVLVNYTRWPQPIAFVLALALATPAAMETDIHLLHLRY
eukprot:2468431-Pleurochrysis_carterae.AAC.1